MTGHDHLALTSDALRVTIDPRVGGTITSITDLRSGLSVLGEVPWDPVDVPVASLGARDENHWLTRYGGGWPLLFPNGGDACTFDGTFHGFHGEASIAPWTVERSDGTVLLRRRFFSVPVTMWREFFTEGDLLVVRERVRMTGPEPVEVMWGHHPTFGSDLLAGPVEITSGAKRVTADDVHDPAANPLLPGAGGLWPDIPGKAGLVDLSRPGDAVSAMAYLHDFDAAWVAVRRLDNAVAVALSWNEARFPCAWLWLELGGTSAPPWHGRGRLIGLEPNTTRSGMGLADARQRGSDLLRLDPGDELSTELRLHVFRPNGPISALDDNGRAILA